MNASKTVDRLLEQVSQKKLMEFTENIASEVRLSGSEEEWRAFLYAKEKLEEFGLTTNLYKKKAFISLPLSAELKVGGTSFPAITHSMAPSTKGEGLNGELLYIGTGSDKDYSSHDVRGKIVLLDGLAIPGAVKKAEEHGVNGIVFINAEYTHEMIVSTVWGNPTPEKKDQYPAIPVVSVNYSDGLKIKQQLGDSNAVPIWFKTKVDTGWRDIPTLEAEKEGESEDFVLFSGHIDSWHLGTMDNGTANATMLEVARVLSAEKLNRTLKIVFWSGHSHGRYAGSALYCDEHWEELYDSCVLHVNIDSVGGKDSVVLSEGNGMAETKELAREVIGKQTGEIYEGSRFGRAGDQSFWGPGVPSLLMGLSEQVPATTPASEAFSRLFGGGKGGGFGWWWHTTEDTLDKINPELLERDCRIYLSIIHQACTSKLLPLDQRKAVEELLEHLLKYQLEAPQFNGLVQAIKKVTSLKEIVDKVYSEIETAEMTERKTAEINKWMHSLSKGLVRLNYVGKDEFDHDPAAGQVPIPLLADIWKLKEVSNDPEDSYLYETVIVRNLNKVNFILNELVKKAKSIQV
jgi:Peptidase family M28/PA domain